MNKSVIKIKGMHCRSCEILIEEELKKVKGIKYVQANFRKNQVKYAHESKINYSEVENAISNAGYKIGGQSQKWISLRRQDYSDLVLALMVLSAVYLLFRYLGFTGFNFGKITQPQSLAIVLLVGLTAGVSTCMALVGGLVLGISARFSEKNPESTTIKKFRPHIFFNLGRILSFFVLGGVVGQIGKAFQISSFLLGLLVIIVGIVMLILGIQLVEIFPKISSAHFSLPSGIAKLLGINKNQEKEYSHTNSFIIGALTFFLPCGFTQAMQIYALSTGKFISGAMIMSIFALGTTPGLLGIGGITSIVKGAFAKKFYKFAGLLVIMLAILNIRNGINLSGLQSLSFAKSNIVSNVSTPKNSNNGNQKVDDNIKDSNKDRNIQIVNMTQSERGYNPNYFKVKKGVPVKWVVNSTSPYTCASALVSRQLGINQFLNEGENDFEFTPQNSGTIAFSCSMGMYRGEFEVVD